MYVCGRVCLCLELCGEWLYCAQISSEQYHETQTLCHQEVSGNQCECDKQNTLVIFCGTHLCNLTEKRTFLKTYYTWHKNTFGFVISIFKNLKRQINQTKIFKLIFRSEINEKDDLYGRNIAKTNVSTKPSLRQLKRVCVNHCESRFCTYRVSWKSDLLSRNRSSIYTLLP